MSRTKRTYPPIKRRGLTGFYCPPSIREVERDRYLKAKASQVDPPWLPITNEIDAAGIEVREVRK